MRDRLKQIEQKNKYIYILKQDIVELNKKLAKEDELSMLKNQIDRLTQINEEIDKTKQCFEDFVKNNLNKQVKPVHK